MCHAIFGTLILIFNNIRPAILLYWKRFFKLFKYSSHWKKRGSLKNWLLTSLLVKQNGLSIALLQKHSFGNVIFAIVKSNQVLSWELGTIFILNILIFHYSKQMQQFHKLISLSFVLSTMFARCSYIRGIIQPNLYFLIHFLISCVVEIDRWVSWPEICSELALGCTADILRLQILSPGPLKAHVLYFRTLQLCETWSSGGELLEAQSQEAVSEDGSGNWPEVFFRTFRGVPNQLTVSAGCWDSFVECSYDSCRNERLRWPCSDLAHELIWKWL